MVGDDALSTWGGEYSRVLESRHPYPDNQNNVTEEVVFEGAAELHVAFDERCATETSYDYVTLYTTPTRAEMVPGTERYTGRRNAGNYRMLSNPVVVKGDRVSVCFFSDGGSNDWGYRLCIKPVYSSAAAAPGKQAERHSPRSTEAQEGGAGGAMDLWARHEASKAASLEAYEIRCFFARALYYASLSESARAVLTFDTPRGPNGYSPHCLYTRSLTCPGAVCLEIEFDSSCQTQYMSDRLELLRPPSGGKGVLGPGEGEPLTYSAGGKEYSAVFHGAYSEHPVSAGAAGTTGAHPSSGWPKCGFTTDRLVARFQSRGGRGWGVRFLCTPTFPRVFEQGGRVLQVQQECGREALFEVLRARALTTTPHSLYWLREAQASVDRYCGLVLANSLSERKARQALLSAHGAEWLCALLRTGPLDVQLRVLASLQGLPLSPPSSEGGEDNERKAAAALRVQLMAVAVQKLGNAQDDIQALALGLLRSALGKDAGSMDLEGVLLACVAALNPVVRREALERITAIAETDNARLARLFELGVMDRVKPLIQSSDEGLRVAAVGAVRQLLRNEEALLNFLDTHGKGFDFVAKFLASASKESQAVGLDLTSLMLTKAPSERGQDGAHQVQVSTRHIYLIQASVCSSACIRRLRCECVWLCRTCRAASPCVCWSAHRPSTTRRAACTWTYSMAATVAMSRQRWPPRNGSAPSASRCRARASPRRPTAARRSH